MFRLVEEDTFAEINFVMVAGTDTLSRSEWINAMMSLKFREKTREFQPGRCQISP